MKRTALLIGLILIVNTAVKSQKYFPFPMGDVYWNVYVLSTCDNDAPPDTFLRTFTIKGDTVIDDLLYKKLIAIDNGDTSNAPAKTWGAIREKNKVIYFRGGDLLTGIFNHPTEYILYDFNKMKGDTMFHNSFGISSVILDVDSIKIGNDYRKRFIIDPHWKFHDTDYIVEGIGSMIEGMLGSITFIPTCGFHYWENICFTEKGQNLYHNPRFVNCFSPKLKGSSIAGNKVKEFKVYPNPFTDEFSIDNIPSGKNCLLKIYDSMGRLVYRTVLSDVSSKINFVGSAGLYALILFDEKGQVLQAEKLIRY